MHLLRWRSASDVRDGTDPAFSDVVPEVPVNTVPTSVPTLLPTGDGFTNPGFGRTPAALIDDAFVDDVDGVQICRPLLTAGELLAVAVVEVVLLPLVVIGVFWSTWLTG